MARAGLTPFEFSNEFALLVRELTNQCPMRFGVESCDFLGQLGDSSFYLLCTHVRYPDAQLLACGINSIESGCPS